jgi:hypothetical protein
VHRRQGGPQRRGRARRNDITRHHVTYQQRPDLVRTLRDRTHDDIAISQDASRTVSLLAVDDHHRANVMIAHASGRVRTLIEIERST